MIANYPPKVVSAIFVTFSGNCEQALKFYQTCFGGLLQFDRLDHQLPGFSRKPVVSGHLNAEKIAICGSDLVHDEGLKIGNHMAVYLRCSNIDERNQLVKKLELGKTNRFTPPIEEPRLIEITDAFGLRWVLGLG
ncbi:glyoxalase [Pedobacter sp.]